MSNVFIATSTMAGAARSSIMATQAEIARRQAEVASGRIADLGLELGSGSREVVSLRQALQWSEAIRGTNAIAASRLQLSQSSLSDMAKAANGFLGALLGAQGSAAAGAVIEAQARSTLAAVTALLNTELAGVHVFGGQSTEAPPLADYHAAGGSAPRQSVQQAFASAFGIAASDPAVVAIDAGAMRLFLENDFAGVFTDAAWTSVWSSASSENPSQKIALGKSQEVGANGNELPFRQLAQALVMVGELGGARLNQQTRDVVLETATELVGSALVGLAAIRSRLGVVEERIASASERLSIQNDLVSERLTRIESRDPYQAATQLNELMTRLEASYATTARIQRLSLLDYL